MFETTKESNGTANFTYGFLAGGIIVGSLALLFAPKKGKALRRNITSAANNLAERTGEYLNSAGEYLNTAKEKANGIISDSKTLLSDGKTKVEKVLDIADKTLKSKSK